MIEEKVRNLIENVIKENNYILDEVVYVKEGSTYFLRIIVDKDGYINIEDCIKINNLISPLLDDIDFIEGSYILDVCSKEKGNI
ncbi:MAG: hypothetical protein IJ565_06370 [Bacilli bacterium]|nr:hypothetical protein [Bacilli bacterium]